MDAGVKFWHPTLVITKRTWRGAEWHSLAMFLLNVVLGILLTPFAALAVLWHSLVGLPKGAHSFVLACFVRGKAARLPVALRMPMLAALGRSVTKTFGYQETLPPLPVPPLGATIERLSSSLRPLMDPEKHADLARRLALFAQEEGGGKRLQRYLQTKAASSPNWLEDWWLEWAYLRGRDALP